MPEDNLEEKIIKILKDDLFKDKLFGDQCGFCVKHISDMLDQEIESRFRKIGTGIANCKKCGKEIVFIRTKLGNFMPVCLDLKSHFIDCPSANKFRKGRAKKEI